MTTEVAAPDAPDAPSMLRQLASAFAVSGAASILAPLPAAIRVDGASFVSSFVLLSGATLVPMTAAVLLLRGARGGLRTFDPSTARSHLAGFAAWCALVVMAFAALGTGLRATTHHHALAGVTFAILACGSAIAAAVVVWRAVEMLDAASPSSRRVALGAFWIAMGIAVLLLGVAGGARAARDHAAGTSALVVDLTAFALAAGFASRPLGNRETTIARFAPVAFVLLPAAVAIARVLPDVSTSVASQAPLYAMLIGAPGPADAPSSAPSNESPNGNAAEGAQP